MSQPDARPDSEEMIMEDVVTAHLLTNAQAILQHGSSFKEEMFIRKRNWKFLIAALDLYSSDTFDPLALTHILSQQGEIANPRAEYEKLIQALKSDRNFDTIFPFWLDGARSRFVDKRMKDHPPGGALRFGDRAAAVREIYVEAANLGGVNLATPMDQAVRKFRKNFYIRRASGGANLLTTGFPALDADCTLDPGRTIVVAARTGVGKTSLASQFAMRAEKQGPVLINHLEMDEEQEVSKIIEGSTVLPGHMIRRAWEANEEHLVRLEDGLNQLSGANVFLSEHRDMNRLEASILQVKPILVVIDYIQLLREPLSFRGTRADYLSRVVNEMASMSRHYKTIFMILSQINRSGVGEPSLEHLKDAGAIEEAADTVWLLWPPNHDQENENKLRVNLGVRKNRMGWNPFNVELLFDGERQRFAPWDPLEAAKLWKRRVDNMARIAGRNPGTPPPKA